MTISPYLPGQGPVVEFEFVWSGERASVYVYSTDTVGVTDPILVFTETRYRPSPMGRTDIEMCEDVTGFALAYVERPEEFDRTPDDCEQVHAEWWRRHGDAITCAILPDCDE